MKLKILPIWWPLGIYTESEQGHRDQSESSICMQYCASADILTNLLTRVQWPICTSVNVILCASITALVRSQSPLSSMSLEAAEYYSMLAASS